MNLEILGKAERLYIGRFGFFQDLSPQASTFLAALEKLDYSRAEIERILENATDVGRIYAAWLLRAIDPNAGHAMLMGLLNDERRILLCVPGSCGLLLTTVGCCARWLLDAGEMPVPAGMPKWADFTEEELAGMEWLKRERYVKSAEGIREIEATNARTEKLIQRGMKERGLRCPHCGVRGLHRSYTHETPRVSYVLCVKCWRTFTG